MKTEAAKTYLNVAGYKFVALDQLNELKRSWLEAGRDLDLKGTVLLSPEGVNLFLAGEPENVNRFLDVIRQHASLHDFEVKESISDHQPFNRFLIRIKKEIIAFGVETVVPERHTSPKISAAELKTWIDENKDFTLLDVRNNYEVEVGTFENALPIDIDSFRDFPEAVDKLPSSVAEKPVVMFCTGGIRCEKAGPMMEQQGYDKIFQLDGGILKYFEDVGGEHYDGDCFVFDKRVALDPSLQETETTQCYACQHVLKGDDLTSPYYDPPRTCPYCFVEGDIAQQQLVQKRNDQISELTSDLPGRTPYHNVRPMNVAKEFDGNTLIDFLTGIHPHVGRDTWLEKVNSGLIQIDGAVLQADSIMRAGKRIEHHIPATTEPDVNGAIKILYEDEEIVVVNKPAPLPQHPSGRFNRNTLMYLLQQIYEVPLRAVHRLDANTSGVVVLAKKRKVANEFRKQLESRSVFKRYVARIKGHPADDQVTLNYPISDTTTMGGGREVKADGKVCQTEIEVICRYEDGTSLVHATPVTGRTNQIRIHLWKWGHAIVGDPMYLADGKVSSMQTLSVDDPPMCLHAQQIRFVHPGTGEEVEFTAPAPSWAQKES